MEDDDEVQTVVCDNGSAMTKVGFAGDDAPTSCFPSIVGYPRAQSGLAAERCVGDEAQAMRNVLHNHSAISHGMVTNWDDMEKIWHHMFFKELRVDPTAHCVLLSEPSLNPKECREKMAQIMFENFNVPAMYVENEAILSLYASGSTTGLVVGCGESVTQVVPCYEGHILPNATMRSDVAGGDLTEHMSRLLAEGGHAFTTSAEKEIVRDIKEKLCYVPKDFEEEMKRPKKDSAKNYELPDGTFIELDSERFRCPEALFKPSHVGVEAPGIHEMAMDSIMKFEINIRRDLFNNIVLTGGSTMLPGIEERLEENITSLIPSFKADAPSRRVRVKVLAPPERKYGAWIGGSIMGSLGVFQSMWIERREYEEVGPSIVSKKCLL